jgi:hypothetical protein
MTLSKRLDNVEDNLSPREALVRWMRGAHQFESLFDYVRWLMDQPDDVYPLVRMQAQVVAAIRGRHKHVPDLTLRPEFYRAQKEVLFLYYLHEQVNLRFLADKEALALRVVLLIREMRLLIEEERARHQLRLDPVNLGGVKRGKPGKTQEKMTETYRAHLEAWLKETEDVLVRLAEFQEAVRLLSVRYFGGEEMLFPEARESLEWNMQTVGTLKRHYADSVLLGAPGSDEEFEAYILAAVGDGGGAETDDDTDGCRWALPDLSLGGKALADQFVLMARAETLEKLGEHREAEDVAERLVRSHSAC